MTDHQVRIHDLDIVIKLDISCGNRSLFFFGKGQFGLIPAVELNGQPLEVQENLDDIFLNTLNGAVLVQHSIDLRFGCRTPGHGGQQNPAQSITQRVAKAPFKRLQNHAGVGLGLILHIDAARSQKFGS